jgi:hypothetical protein
MMIAGVEIERWLTKLEEFFACCIDKNWGR